MAMQWKEIKGVNWICLYFPSPALPGSGSKGIISAFQFKAPP
jgi:hypothetical protein